MDANKLFQGFCENILKPIIQEAVSEALPPHKPQIQYLSFGLDVIKIKPGSLTDHGLPGIDITLITLHDETIKVHQSFAHLT